MPSGGKGGKCDGRQMDPADSLELIAAESEMKSGEEERETVVSCSVTVDFGLRARGRKLRTGEREREREGKREGERANAQTASRGVAAGSEG